VETLITEDRTAVFILRGAEDRAAVFILRGDVGEAKRDIRHLVWFKGFCGADINAYGTFFASRALFVGSS